MQTIFEALKNDNQHFSVTIEEDKEYKNYVGHFANGRIDRETLPEGWYAYDLVHGDENDGEICKIKNGSVMVNHFGTFYTTEPLPLKEGESLDVDGNSVDYNFSPEIFDHEPWDGDLPIEFLGEDNNIEEFYIAHHNKPLNTMGGIEGRVRHNPLDKCDIVSLYIPKTSIPENSELCSKLCLTDITINTGMAEEKLEVYKLPVFQFPQSDGDGMYLFEYQDYIMQKAKSQVFEYAPEAFKNMFPEEYKERSIKGFVDVAEWHIDEKAFERFCDKNIPIGEVGYVGTVDLGNYWYQFHDELLDLNLYKNNAVSYDQYRPMIMGDLIPIRYVGATENAKFDFDPSRWSDNILPVLSQESADGNFFPRTDESTRDIESFKRAFIEKLLKDNYISLEELPKYIELKATGKNYYEQFYKAQKDAAASFSKADKLTPKNLEELGEFYTHDLADRNNPDVVLSSAERCVIAAKEMAKDGYSNIRIGLCLKAHAFPEELVKNAIDELSAKSHDTSKGMNKNFKAYIKDLQEGKGSEPLAVRNEILDCYESIKKGGTPTTVQADVKNIMAKYGLSVKEKGVGWEISAPQQVKQNVR